MRSTTDDGGYESVPLGGEIDKLAFRGGVRLTGFTESGEVLPSEARTIQDIFAGYLEGKTLTAIAKELTDAGVRARRTNHWSATSIRSILSNPKYAGAVVVNGDLVFGTETTPRIISQSDFTAVQQLLGRRSRHQTTTRKYRRLGTGLFLCSICGTPLRSNSHSYWCRHKGHVNRLISSIDTEVLRQVINYVDNLRQRRSNGVLDMSSIASEPMRLLIDDDSLDFRTMLENATIQGKRSILSSLCEVSVLPVHRGVYRVDVEKTIKIRWKIT